MFIGREAELKFGLLWETIKKSPSRLEEWKRRSLKKWRPK